MEFKNNKLKLSLIILAGLVLLIMILATVSSSRENKRLKRAIKANDKKIEILENQKTPLFKKIKEDSVKIVKKDSLIFVLQIKEQTLKNTIKIFKNENNKIKSNYNNSSINERVRIFSELATRADSLQ
tara:strand:+ start:19225 stop:19608 length:384 start_codon:yes stop_codon:yes gene_type:complete